MIQLIIAAWVLSGTLIFLPVMAGARLIWRRLRPVSKPKEPAAVLSEAPPAGEAAKPPPGTAVSTIDRDTSVPERPAAVLPKLEALATVAEPAAAASDQKPPSAAPVAEEEAPVAPPGPPPFTVQRRALGLFGSLAMVALYVVFIGSSVYLMPRLLIRILDNEHPMAAITSQSMYPVLKRGDLVLIEGVDKPADLRVGDILAFESEHGFAIHRIVNISGETITTQGDANFTEDEPISFEQVIGRALTIRGRLAKIPLLGNIPLIFSRTSDGGHPQDGDLSTDDTS